jgi:uncharacterized protein (TIGR02246 family)
VASDNDPTTTSTQAALTIDAATQEARAAVDSFVAELQAGLDASDAEVHNRSFADDVLWGTPYGEFVEGYATLHPIHREMQARGHGGRSRYEVVRVQAPGPDLAVGLVRRVSLDRSAAPGFDEMALYVLIRRNRRWWLAAGQNTPVREKPAQTA